MTNVIFITIVECMYWRTRSDLPVSCTDRVLRDGCRGADTRGPV